MEGHLLRDDPHLLSILVVENEANYRRCPVLPFWSLGMASGSKATAALATDSTNLDEGKGSVFEGPTRVALGVQVSTFFDL